MKLLRDGSAVVICVFLGGVGCGGGDNGTGPQTSTSTSALTSTTTTTAPTALAQRYSGTFAPPPPQQPVTMDLSLFFNLPAGASNRGTIRPLAIYQVTGGYNTGSGGFTGSVTGSLDGTPQSGTFSGEITANLAGGCVARRNYSGSLTSQALNWTPGTQLETCGGATPLTAQVTPAADPRPVTTSVATSTVASTTTTAGSTTTTAPVSTTTTVATTTSPTTTTALTTTTVPTTTTVASTTTTTATTTSTSTSTSTSSTTTSIEVGLAANFTVTRPGTPSSNYCQFDDSWIKLGLPQNSADCTLDASSSTTPGGTTITSYQWTLAQFDEAAYGSDTVTRTTPVFANPRFQCGLPANTQIQGTLTLTVINSAGSKATSSRVITIFRAGGC